MDSSSILAVYQRRLADRNTRAEFLDTRSSQISNLRLLAFAAIAIVLWLVLKEMVSPWWLLAPVFCFAASVVWHDRVIRALTNAQRAKRVYAWGIARAEDRWSQFGRRGERFRATGHVYAEDLDIFGEQSLFQLLSTARTRMGEDTLAAWLLAPAKVEVVLERQKAIAELRDRLDFREQLAVAGEDIPPDFDPAKLLAWAEGPNLLHNTATRIAAPILAVAATAAITVAFWKALFAPLAAVFAIELAIQFHYRRRIQQVIASVEGAGESVMLFSTLVKIIEQGQFECPLLQRLRRRLGSGAEMASRALAAFGTRIDLVDSRHNLILRVLNIPWLYELQTAFVLEGWRHRHGPHIRGWLDTIGEMEALLSLAAFSYEHPGDPFPEVDGSAGPHFKGESLGHPLIATDRNVRNSTSLDLAMRALVVSGSNMSGKSTYLRTIGLNAILAMAGSTVRAKQLKLSPLQVGSSLHVLDSLQTGRSGFASELDRLRQIMSLMESGLPVLFLVDELLHGTNSHDRLIGGQALLRAFLAHGAVGVVTTHDLSITEIPSDLANLVRNAHFEDRVEDGRMIFDYVLRSGVVARSNALELMRSIGLDV